MKKSLNIIYAAGLALALTACSNDNSDDQSAKPTENAAIINTVATDYSDSDVEIVDLNVGIKNGILTSTAGGYATSQSDYDVSVYGKHFYRIGKYGIDLITKYGIDSPANAIYSYSTLDNGSTDTSNPYQLVFESETKAYLLRYGTSKVWIVNPSASAEENYKIGEIDLSAYDNGDGDGAPEMSCGVIAGGKLFIALQRLSYYSVIANNSYVAVIDTSTNLEIDTTPNIADDFKGIQLKTNNPQSILSINDKDIFVQSIGTWSKNYLGGIEKINTQDYTTSIVLDDGDDTNTDASLHPYGRISGLALISDTLGYFVGYNAYGDNSLRQFNPSTGEVKDGIIANLGNGVDKVDIRNINNGPENTLWVSIADNANPRVLVIDTIDNSVLQEIETTYNPTNVVFGFKN